MTSAPVHAMPRTRPLYISAEAHHHHDLVLATIRPAQHAPVPPHVTLLSVDTTQYQQLPDGRHIKWSSAFASDLMSSSRRMVQYPSSNQRHATLCTYSTNQPTKQTNNSRSSSGSNSSDQRPNERRTDRRTDRQDECIHDSSSTVSSSSNRVSK